LQRKSEEYTMKRPKEDETLSIRTSTDVKQMLRMAAEREQPSSVSMMEVLTLAYVQQHGSKTDAALERHEKE
jgi:uncharacterized protein (DUF1778 family)